MKLPFNPVKNGWHFPANSIAEAMGVKRCSGLCGGMSLAAVNYFRYGMNIPSIDGADLKEISKPQAKNSVLPTESTSVNAVLNFILYSQFAVFESPDILKQKANVLFPDTKANHHLTSIKEVFPKIKKALDNDCFVILGLRPGKEDYQACQQALVYGYDDKDYTLYMYDCNHPNEEVTVKSNGYRLVSSNGKEYSSYYPLMTLNSNTRSGLNTYDTAKNFVYNFSVKPPLA